MRLKSLVQVLVAAFSLLLATLLSLQYVQQVSLAQAGQITMTKTLNKSDNVVRVGEVLSFTIAITNNSGFTLTNVTLVDNYDHTTLAFAQASPVESFHTTGIITWTNVATPPIFPGQGIRVTVTFTAEHPKSAVVNFARAQDITHTMGSISQTAETSKTQEAIGGAAPVVKFVSPPGSIIQAGLPVTFTHLITNDGAAIMTHLPLTDTYDPNFLEFNFAIPTPSVTMPPGLVAWTDLTSHFGDLPAFATVVVTTVFTATTQVVSTTNQASTAGALDQFGNKLAVGTAQVPIIIIADTPTPTPTPVPVEVEPDDDSDEVPPAPTSTPTPTPIPLPRSTPTATAPTLLTSTLIGAGQGITITTAETDTSVPSYLPETGQLQEDRSSIPSKFKVRSEESPDRAKLNLLILIFVIILLYSIGIFIKSNNIN